MGQPGLRIAIRIGNIDKQMPGDDVDVNVIQASYGRAMPGVGPHGRVQYAMPQRPPMHMAGVTTPSFGMPITGTPIGLAGPPHIPLGGPAGLQMHTMRNHTKVHMPQPTTRMGIHVKQHPGLSYPKPASTARIMERTIRPAPLTFGQGDATQQYCP